ncbi:MAG TPA: copper chaperone PCu(A)C [Spongiibacteraceae bacterium]|nr:copper chaperone PCu(A)C [Spongiibacteraceae bacterium]
MKKMGLIAALVLSLSNAAWSVEALQMREAYVREMPPGQSTSAAFMKLVNASNRPVAIVAVTSDGAGQTEIHRSHQVDGMMQMERVMRLEIPAHGQQIFAPGGYHLMLINLKRSYRAGDKINITLLDEEGRFYKASFPVVNMLGAASPGQ